MYGDRWSQISSFERQTSTTRACEESKSRFGNPWPMETSSLNVLVNPHGEPTLIDYGEVRRANAALDPVTLELSAVFHPAMIGKLAGWPSEAQANAWHDLDAYCDGSPIDGFVRECRAWAVE
jgi:hypothetical protein